MDINRQMDQIGRMKMLTRDQILNAQDIKTEEVDVPEWGGAVTVKAMDGLERDRFEMSIRDGTENVRSKMAVMTIVDESGKPMFTAGDLDALGKKSGSALGRVFDVASRLAGFTKDEQEKLEKN